jgi:hypothetical protein
LAKRSSKPPFITQVPSVPTRHRFFHVSGCRPRLAHQGRRRRHEYVTNWLEPCPYALRISGCRSVCPCGCPW